MRLGEDQVLAGNVAWAGQHARPGRWQVAGWHSDQAADTTPVSPSTVGTGPHIPAGGTHPRSRAAQRHPPAGGEQVSLSPFPGFWRTRGGHTVPWLSMVSGSLSVTGALAAEGGGPQGLTYPVVSRKSLPLPGSTHSGNSWAPSKPCRWCMSVKVQKEDTLWSAEGDTQKEGFVTAPRQ